MRLPGERDTKVNILVKARRFSTNTDLHGIETAFSACFFSGPIFAGHFVNQIVFLTLDCRVGLPSRHMTS